MARAFFHRLEYASIAWRSGAPLSRVGGNLCMPQPLAIQPAAVLSALAYLEAAHPQAYRILFPARDAALWENPDYRTAWVFANGPKFDQQTGKREPTPLLYIDAINELLPRIGMPRGAGGHRTPRHHLLTHCRRYPVMPSSIPAPAPTPAASSVIGT